jgi:hypothetical protein
VHELRRTSSSTAPGSGIGGLLHEHTGCGTGALASTLSRLLELHTILDPTNVRRRDRIDGLIHQYEVAA